MSRVRLFEHERPRTIHMVLEDMQSAVLEIEAAVAENPALAPVATPQDDDLLEIVIERGVQDMNDSAALVESALPAIGALEDTAYNIAPAITETRQTDVLLVRQIAVTAGDALGLTEEEIIGQTQPESLLGQPLVLEGFKDTVLKAARNIWRVIMNVLDAMWTTFQAIFRRQGARVKQVTARAKNMKADMPIPDLAISGEISHASVSGKAANGKDIAEGITGIANRLTISASLVAGMQEYVKSVLRHIGQPTKPEDLAPTFTAIADSLTQAFATLKTGQIVYTAKDGDYVATVLEGGGSITFKGLSAVIAAKDPLEKAKLFQSVTLEYGKGESAAGSKTDISGPELVQIATASAKLAGVVAANVSNQSEGVMRIVKRQMQSVADTMESKWGAILDKAPADQQAALRPYPSAIAQLMNKYVHLVGQAFGHDMRSCDTALRAAIQIFDAANGKQNADNKAAKEETKAE